MRFECPQVLLLLAVLPPALAVFLWWSARKKRALLAQFIEPRLAANLTAGISPARQKVRWALLVAAVTCLIIAAARPQWGFSWEETKQRGLDIVMAIDTSKSMLASDIAPNRLARAKLAALDLMQQAKSDRLGLVAFAGDAFMQCPLTVDDVAFRQSVDSLDVYTLPQGGTAIAEAIETTRKAFKYEADNHKVLVLFTDGEDQDAGAVGAATKAAAEGMRIFTVGIGSPDGELLRISDGRGNTDYVRDADGNVVKSRLNEKLLTEIARVGNGFYLPLRGASTMDVLYERGLAPLPKSEITAKLVKRYNERFHWPLLLACLLLIMEILTPERKAVRRRAPAVEPSTSARRTAAAALLFCALLPCVSHASAARALKDYRSGNFTNALTEYERLLKEQTEKQLPVDPRLHFNAGAAAYRATNYSAAIEHYTAVLTAPDIRLQAKAYYNLGNVQYRLGAQAESLDKLEQTWKESLKYYRLAVELDKTYADAAFNLAFVEERLKQLALLRELARRAKEAADEATRQREYHQARQIMEELLQNNAAAKPFEEFTKKLGEIDAIANPNQP